MLSNNKILFRFTILFVVLWILPFPLSLLKQFNITTDFPPDVYSYFIPSLGESIFNLDSISIQPNGSGDKTYHYLILLFQFVLALFGAIVWSTFAGGKLNYEKLNYWFLVVIRVYLGYCMIYYGMAKVVKSQFPETRFTRLIQQYGDSSPMGLAWTFFGHSKGYNLFIGLGETVGGILLFHRKTSILGALILVPVISNIVAINFFYDIPVKIFSTQLLLLTLLILSPHVARLAKVIFTNPTPSFISNRHQVLKNIIVTLFLGIVFFFVGKKVVETRERRKAKPAISGLQNQYKVTSYHLNQASTSNSIVDENRWEYIGLERKNYFAIISEDKSRLWCKMEADTTKQIITLSDFDRPEIKYNLNYTFTDSTLKVNGIYKNDTISVVANAMNIDSFQLNKIGFRWINEFPYNR